MSLKNQIIQAIDSFEKISSKDFLEILKQIQTKLQNELTREYLQGKLNTINQTELESDKKKLCKNLLPYLNWYVQGFTQ